jgi:AcrR family transcriptional regulator
VTAEEDRATRRRYRSPLRQQQAGQTRAVVVAAATALFEAQGWSGTGMRDVAKAAGVSVETVYAAFRSKSELLAACVDLAVVADVEPVPLARRPAFAALGRGSRAQRIRAAARLLSGIHARTAGVLLAVREAAASEPDMAQWRQSAEQGRRADVEQGAALIAGRRVTDQEVDGLWAVMAVEVYELLTMVRGWTPRQYERWLATVIERLLPEEGKAS